MGFKKLFRQKRSGSRSSGPSSKRAKREATDNTDETFPKEDTQVSSIPQNVNIAYPFYDVKATSFPPPLSIDASVLTEPQKSNGKLTSQVQTSAAKEKNGDKVELGEKAKEKEKEEKNKEEKKEETDTAKVLSVKDECNVNNCTKENCTAENCNHTKKHVLESTISPTKLTEIINSSIKEAMQTIVKQCSMEEKKDLGYKQLERRKEGQKEALRSSICYKDGGLNKMKREHRSRVIHDQYNNYSKLSKHHDNAHVSNLLLAQEKYDNIHPRCKKIDDEGARIRNHRTKDSVCGDTRSRKHSGSSNNVKTDNRKMTGNVNIYICSEATENTQGNNQEKVKAQTCQETSSETTTEHSNEEHPARTASISSCKLVSNILKRRKKLQGQDSLDLVPEKEDTHGNDSTESNLCNCDATCVKSCITSSSGSNVIDINKTSCEDIDIENERSLLSLENEEQSKNSSFGNNDVKIDNSNLSFETSRLIICDNTKSNRPCTTIYPTELTYCPSRSIRDNTDRTDHYRDTDYLQRNCQQWNIWGYDTKKILPQKDEDNSWLAELTRGDCYRSDNLPRIDSSKKYHSKSIKPHNHNDRIKSMCRNNRNRCYSSVCRTIERKHDVENVPIDSIRSGEWLPISVCANADRIDYKKCNLDKDISGNREINDNETNVNENLRNICKCREEDSESIVVCNQWNTGNSKVTKKRSFRTNEKERLTQQWSVCNCIAEEEEEDYCTNKYLKEDTICSNLTEDIKESYRKLDKTSRIESLSDPQKSADKRTDEIPSEGTEKLSKKSANEETDDKERKISGAEKQDKLTPNKNINKKDAKDEEKKKDESKDETDTTKNYEATSSPISGLRKLNIESRLLKSLTKSRTKPEVPIIENKDNTQTSAQITISSPTSSKTTDQVTRNLRRDIKLKPPSLKRFKDTQQDKLEKPPVVTDQKQKQLDSTITEKPTGEDSKEEKKTEQEEKVKDSILRRILNKIIDSIYRRKVKPAKSENESEVTENTLSDRDAVKDTDKSMSDAEKNKLSTRVSSKERKYEENKNIVASPASVFDNKKDSKVTVQSTQDSPTKNGLSASKNSKKVTTHDINQTSPQKVKEEKFLKNTNEDVIRDINREQQPKSKLLTAITSKKSTIFKVPDITRKEPIKTPESEKILADLKSQKITDTLVTQKGKSEFVVGGSKKESANQEPLKSPDLQYTITQDTVTGDNGRNTKIDVTKQTSSDVKDGTITVCVSSTQQEKEKEGPKSIALQYEDAESYLSTRHVTSKYPKSRDNEEDFYFDNGKKVKGCCECCQVPISQCNNGITLPRKICVKKERNASTINTGRCEPQICVDRNRNWKSCNCRKQILCTDYQNYRCNCIESCRPKVVSAYRKSMFCLYCDSPRDRCVCRAPVQNCSYCGVAMDHCRCQEQEIFNCDGRPVLTEVDNDRTICVTAWKPRREVRRYFARNVQDLQADSNDDCCCHEKLKPHGSDDLPYQRLSVFSDVMNELQQKISESVCCTQCRRVPCCCNTKTDKIVECGERKIKHAVSPRARCQIPTRDTERPRSKSPNNYKRNFCQTTNDLQRTVPVTFVCCACKATPCRCRRNKSIQKRPRAKCYYCKSSPCICITAREHKPRPCSRCADSPRRMKEKEIIPCGKISTNQKNSDKKVICVS